MTREEAKRRLLNIERCTPIHTREDARDFEALEMAIKALEQNESAEEWYKLFVEKLEQEPKTDYKKYIDALRKCANEHDKDITPTFKIRVSDLCRDTANLLENIKQESSNDAISREAVKAYKYHRTMYPNFEDYVDLLPSVEQKPKTGHWIADVFVDECSVCGEQTLFFEDQQKNYCPNCGARMVEQERSEE